MGAKSLQLMLAGKHPAISGDDSGVYFMGYRGDPFGVRCASSYQVADMGNRMTIA